MAITQTQFETELEEAKAAVVSGDYATARTAILKAEITLKGLPDYGVGSRYVRHRQEAIDGLYDLIDREEERSANAAKTKRVFAKYYRG